MHKVTTMVALVALLTVVAAGVAYAASIVGNANPNYLTETCKGDTMYGRAGDDVLDADNCGGETDVLYAGRATTGCSLPTVTSVTFCMAKRASTPASWTNA
jgi:hypothetical protein